MKAEFNLVNEETNEPLAPRVFFALTLTPKNEEERAILQLLEAFRSAVSSFEYMEEEDEATLIFKPSFRPCSEQDDKDYKNQIWPEKPDENP